MPIIAVSQPTILTQQAMNHPVPTLHNPVIIQPGYPQAGPYTQPAPGGFYPQPIPVYPPPMNYGHPANPAYQQKIQINPYTFVNEVKVVGLDDRNCYLGQEICYYCSQRFSREFETRILPCQHAFHGKCVYDAMAVGNNKNCLVCKTQYL